MKRIKFVFYISLVLSLLFVSEVSARKKKKGIAEPYVKTEKLSDHIHIVSFYPEGINSLIVEFKDYFAILESPITSENGEKLIGEAKKISQEKPVKYFAFSHYHPENLRGIRPFVHKGATILTLMENFDSITYLVRNRKPFQVDSLHMQPKRLDIEIISDTKTVTDGEYTMQMYRIGNLYDGIEDDFTVFYFPDDKLLFEPKLIEMSKDGFLKKASEKELIIYDAIQNLDIEVDTIIRSWTPTDRNIKTIIPFSELEETIFLRGN
ncbi:hypothetical protein [Dysgonomonas sp. 520]|uniref:hypothetical protein n=1 Tax=Dysgonomonas sp. 520 TaxID=2302931 RepID=UPI0013D77937|nr:hypothetical protein [Dysgonomonas sp. 520]NDW09782.1 hypothetical protein [Dysgonomonas sp. 520]